MARDTRVVNARPQDVWAVLANGWLYPSWVVGASRMRKVGADWPAAGADLHHSVGTWPILIDDTTTVLVSRPPHVLRLRVRAWPGGEAEVEIQLHPVPGRTDRTEVVMVEHTVKGPGHWFPQPVVDLALHPRNRETLQRLAFLAEGRPDPGEQSPS